MNPDKPSSELSYSEIEVRSYLPPGWNLEDREGRYEPREHRWQIDVQDVSELVSTLAVAKKEAEQLGRIPALRAAIDRLVRKT